MWAKADIIILGLRRRQKLGPEVVTARSHMLYIARRRQDPVHGINDSTQGRRTHYDAQGT